MKNAMDENQQFGTTPSSNNLELKITILSRSFLKEIAKWSTFFAVLGYIFGALIIISGISIAFAYIAVDNTAAANDIYINESPFEQLYMIARGFGAFIGIIYMLLSLFYIFPSYYLMKAAQKIKSALALNNDFELEKGFQNLKSVFKFWGILTIFIIGLYLVIFLGMIAFGAAMIPTNNF